MFNLKTVLVTALLATVAAASFAQTPVPPKAAGASVPAAAMVPADAASKPKVQKPMHKAKKPKATKAVKASPDKKAMPAAPAASAAK